MSRKFHSRLLQSIIKSIYARNSVTAFIVTAYATVAGFSVQWLAARVLSPFEFGTYSIGMSLIGIGSIFCLSGSDTTILLYTTRYSTKCSAHPNKVLLKTLIKWFAATSLLSITCIFAVSITSLNIRLLDATFIGLCTFLIPATILLQSRLRGSNRMVLSFLPEGAIRPTIVLTGLAISFGTGVSLSAADVFFVIVLGSVVAFCCAANWVNNTPPVSKIKDRTYNLKMEKQAWLKNNATFLFISAGNALNTQIGVLIFGWMRLTVDAGIFGIVIRLSTLTIFITSVINIVFSTKFVELHTERKYRELRKVTLYAATFSFLSALPISLVFLIFPSEVMSIFGSHFISGSFALQVSAAGYLIHSAIGPVLSSLALSGQQKSIAKIQYIAMAINAITTSTLAYQIGIDSAAYGILVNQVFSACAVTLLIYRSRSAPEHD
tara:strand:- start:131 stop:1438 length:1308 start_codon:yes stop_codon:yes gene_type:complete